MKSKSEFWPVGGGGATHLALSLKEGWHVAATHFHIKQSQTTLAFIWRGVQYSLSFSFVYG